MALRRTAKFLIEALVGVIAGCAIVGGVALWMLTRGPVAVNFLTPQLEQAFQNEEGVHVKVGETHLVWEGWGDELALEAKNWTVFDRDDQELAHFPEVGIQVSIPAIFRGIVAPTNIAVTGVQLSLHRTDEGGFGFGRLPSLELGPPDQRDGVEVSDFAPGILEAVMQEPQPDDPLSYLRQITITDAWISLFDQQLGLEWNAPDAELTIARNRLGLTGRADLPLHLDAKQVGRVEGGLLFDRAAQTLKFQVGFDEFSMASAARYLPAVDFLSTTDLAVSGEVNSTIHLDGRLEDLVFAMTSGPGTIPAPDGFAAPFDIERSAFEGRYSIETGLLAVEETEIQFLRPDGAQGMNLLMTANVQFSEQGVGLSAKLAGRDVRREDILAIWPESSEGGGRPWIEENLLGGLVQAAELDVQAAVPGRNFDAVDLRKMEGGFTFEDATLHYLRPLPPITDASGTGTVSLDEIVFFVEEGRIGNLESREAVIELYDLATPEHKARIRAPVSGPLEDAVALLNHPRLRLVDELGFDAASIRGRGDMVLEIMLPLDDEMTFAEVEISGVGSLSTVNVDDFVADENLTNGEFTLKVNKTGMTLSGPAEFAGIPVEANWSEVFDPGADFGRQLEVVAEVITDANRALFGLETAPYLVGPVSAQMVLQQRADGSGQLRVISDLSDAELRVDEAGYLKEAGPAGQAAATFHYDSEGVTAVRDIRLSGPDLSLAGNALLTETRDDLLILELTSLQLGKSDLKNVYFTEEDGVPHISVESGTLDASRWLTGDADSEIAEPSETERAENEPDTFEPLVLSADRLSRVYLGEERYLENVSLEVERVESGYEMIELRGELPSVLWRANGQLTEEDQDNAAKAFRLSFGPQVDTNGRATHGLDFAADDMGAVLRAFDILESIEGGQVRVRGGMDGPLFSGPLSASVDARDYALIEAPTLAKVLSVATLTGVGQALDGPGLNFSRLVGDFTYDDDMVATDLLRAYGPGLGVTAKGDFDLEGDRTNAGGTLVPAYALNQVLGAIPVLGPLLTGGEGGGLIGVVYRVEGDLEDPEVSVNPLSALAPGFLRGLFEIDAGDEQEANRFAPSLYPEGVEGVR